MLPLNRSKLEQTLAIAQAVESLTGSSGWAHYKSLVEAEIRQALPSVTEVDGVDQAIKTASRLAYVNGLKRALDLAEKAPRRVADLQKTLDKLSAQGE